MAQIVKRTAKSGEPRYDVRLRIDGRVVTKTFRRRKDADAWAATVEARRLAGTVVDPAAGRLSVEQLAEQWLRSNPGERDGTLARDQSAIDVHIVPALGRRRIGSIRQPDIQQLVNQWSKDLAPKTVSRTYGVLRAMFTYAVSADMLGRSPCRHVNLPRGVRHKPRFLDQREVAAIVSGVDDRYRLMVWIAAMLGLRWGEIAGLRVGSVDVLARRLMITDAVARDGRGRSVLGPPESQAGIRALALPDALARELAAHIAAMGLTAADGSALLFPSASGSPMSYSNFRQRVWQPAVEKAGLCGTGFHDLRRTNASIMVAEGVDLKTAQRRLGHSDARLTLELYAQATSAADRTASDALGRRFSKVFEVGARDGRAMRRAVRRRDRPQTAV